MVQYYSDTSGSAAPVVHADSPSYTGGERRVPKILARGSYNQFGFDQGVPASFKQKGEAGDWHLPVSPSLPLSLFLCLPDPGLSDLRFVLLLLQIMTRWPSFIQMNVFGFDDYFFGDADGDGVIDRLPPNSLSPSSRIIRRPPPSTSLTRTSLTPFQPRTTST